MPDASGTPTTPDAIPKYNTAADPPSGKGFNTAMDAIQAALVARVSKPSGILSGETSTWNGTAWARSSVTRLGATSLGSGSPDATNFLRGDSSWQTVTIPEAMPVGMITAYGGAAAPTGWLLCDGSSQLRASFAALFAVIGTTYGSVDGTHFTVPDLQGRMAVGKGTHADVSALNNSDGLAVANRRPKHKHTVVQPTISAPTITRTADVALSDPTHTHTSDMRQNAGAGSATAATIAAGNTGSTDYGNVQSVNAASTGITVSVQPTFSSSAPVATLGTVGDQTGTPPVDTSAYLVVNYIIKT